MLRKRNYWVYSLGLAVAWAIALILAVTIRGVDKAQPYFLVFFGFFIGWVSTTIARYVYLPPKKWDTDQRQR
jgi:hypothetical protein